MVRSRYLAAVVPTDFVNRVDRELAAEADEMNKFGTKIPTAKEEAEAKKRAKDVAEAASFDEQVQGLKRRAATMDESEDVRARRKLAYEDDVMVETIDSDSWFRVDFARFRRRIRDEMIESFVAERYNHACSLVVKAALELTQPTDKHLEEEISSKSFSAHQLSLMLKPSHSLLSDGVYFAEDYDEDEDMDDEDEPQPIRSYGHHRNTKGPRKRPLAELVSEYLELMSTLSCTTPVFKRSNTPTGVQYRVNRGPVLHGLRLDVVEACISTHFNSLIPKRLLRILCTKGKLDEKQVSKMGMLPIGDARRWLQGMMNYGVVGLQEVPRTTDRAPSRTFFLWWTKDKLYEESCTRQCLDAILRVQRRQIHERTAFHAALTKAERHDVKLDPSLLTEHEQDELKMYEKRREKLQVAELRLWLAYWLLVEKVEPKK